MKTWFKGALVLASWLAVSTAAWGYKLSPCLRVLTLENGYPSELNVRWINPCPFVLPEQYKLAVHEHMTIAALAAYRGAAMRQQPASNWTYRYMSEPAWTVEERAHETHAIIFGTWWNDEPLMRTWGQGADFGWGAWAARKTLDPDRDDYPGGIANCRVPADQHLGRKSHFGSLQHLHFMTTLGKKASTPEARVTATTNEALKWMAFAYQVATGDLKPDQQLTRELERAVGLPSIAANHCVKNAANVKIRTLFTRLRQNDEKYRHAITPDVALGSMFHILQDSFSSSHTCRIERKVGTGVHAVLQDVSNYGEQDEDAHGELDRYPGWLIEYLSQGRRTYDNDPIAIGAWLIKAVDKKLPWKEVDAFLRETIFAPATAEENAQKVACLGQAS